VDYFQGNSRAKQTLIDGQSRHNIRDKRHPIRDQILLPGGMIQSTSTNVILAIQFDTHVNQVLFVFSHNEARSSVDRLLPPLRTEKGRAGVRRLT
jgi:hypothetical protein